MNSISPWVRLANSRTQVPLTTFHKWYEDMAHPGYSLIYIPAKQRRPHSGHPREGDSPWALWSMHTGFHSFPYPVKKLWDWNSKAKLLRAWALCQTLVLLLIDLWPWSSYLTPLCLGSPFCKMGLVTNYIIDSSDGLREMKVFMWFKWYNF